MKIIKELMFSAKAACGVVAVAAILAAGCGQSPAPVDTANSADAEALRKENASLKKQLSDARSRIDSLRAQLNDATPIADGEPDS